VIVLEVADLVVIASRTLGLDTAAALELVDPAAAELALGQVRPGRLVRAPRRCPARACGWR
jgi:hypothetical protein